MTLIMAVVAAVVYLEEFLEETGGAMVVVIITIDQYNIITDINSHGAQY